MKKIVFKRLSPRICINCFGFIFLLFTLYNNVVCQTANNDNTLSNEEIYYEKGCHKFSEGAYTQALYWFEKGIEQGPLYEENYYGASTIYFLSTETVWGVMYGELFMILSQNDSLKAEVSKKLFEAYFNAFTLFKGKATADFNNDIIVYSDSFERHNKFPDTFNTLMSNAANNIYFIDISSLITIRQRFLSLIKSKASDFMNPLFAYWDNIIASGNWQAYNYWLFAYGNKSESATWARENKQHWNKFLSWLDKNPIPLSETDKFSRYLME